MNNPEIPNPFIKADGINQYSEIKIKSMIQTITKTLSYLETEELIRRLKER